MRWSADRMDQLEHAARRGLRVALETRRGTEYIVVARRVTVGAKGDTLIGLLPMTGEEVTFPLHDIAAFQVIGL
ncbi:MAG: hypothetical protein ACREOC_00780 [Gemmatimonadales bacterium]